MKNIETLPMPPSLEQAYKILEILTYKNQVKKFNTIIEIEKVMRLG